jgi:hypothetical protein
MPVARKGANTYKDQYDLVKTLPKTLSRHLIVGFSQCEFFFLPLIFIFTRF